MSKIEKIFHKIGVVIFRFFVIIFMFIPLIGAIYILDKYIDDRIRRWTIEAQGAAIGLFFCTHAIITVGGLLWIM